MSLCDEMCLSSEALACTIPALVEHGVLTSVPEVRAFSTATLLDIIKHAGPYIRCASLALHRSVQPLST